jgi:hypothetical protein
LESFGIRYRSILLHETANGHPAAAARQMSGCSPLHDSVSKEVRMRKALATAALAIALVAAPATITTPAFAGPVTVPTPTADSQATSQVTTLAVWRLHGKYRTQLACITNGAAGQVRGQWIDFDCFYSDYEPGPDKHFLWVLRN